MFEEEEIRPCLNYSLIPKFQITFGPVSVDHVLTVFSGKIPVTSRNTHELFSFFEYIVSVRDVQIRQLGKNMGGQVKCRTVRSSRRKCLDHMSSKPSTQTLMFPGRASPLRVSEVVKMQLD